MGDITTNIEAKLVEARSSKEKKKILAKKEKVEVLVPKDRDNAALAAVLGDCGGDVGDEEEGEGEGGGGGEHERKRWILQESVRDRSRGRWRRRSRLRRRMRKLAKVESRQARAEPRA